jgi:hypothetical protein
MNSSTTHRPSPKIEAPAGGDRLLSRSDAGGANGWSGARRTLQRDLGVKLTVGAGVGVLCTLMFQMLQHFGPGIPRMCTDCIAWRLVPFDPGWTWVYLSMMALVGLAWLFLPDAREARRFACFLLGSAAVGWVTFFLYPTGSVRPAVDSPPWIYRALVAADAPTNGLPCLHSTLSILAAAALTARGRIFASGWGRFISVAWVIAITVSVFALRQHTGLDVVIGSVLGLAIGGAYVWNVAQPRRRPVATERIHGEEREKATVATTPRA